MPAEGKHSAQDRTQHIADVSDVRIQRHRDTGNQVRLVCAFPELLIQHPELFNRFLFMAENLHDFLSFHHLLDIAVHPAEVFLL